MRSRKGLTKQQRALYEFLDLLCVEWGFCIPAEAADMISRRTRLTSVEFATAILHAEGMHPEHEVAWLRKIRNRFRERFGETLSMTEN